MANDTPEPLPRRRGRPRKVIETVSEPSKSVSSASAPEWPDPAAVSDTDDPGDATLQNYRYQHAYGAILLASARRGEVPYVAIWCEHHEDLLAERTDGTYDGYQIKTSRPENGAWRMNDEDVVKSIGRFVDLIGEFGDRIGSLFFVSNTDFDHCSDSVRDEKRRRRRPRAFLDHVRSCASHSDIASPYDATFLELQGECGCQPDVLFVVLRRLDLINGPSRDSFHAVVAHEHLGRLPECCNLEPARLDEFCEDLIALVCLASSLVVTDPIRHLRPLINSGNGIALDPTLAAKRLTVAEVVVYRTRNPQPNRFHFPGQPTIQIGGQPRKDILQAKLERGDLAEQVEYLWGRERAIEYNLLTNASLEPAKTLEMLKQLEEIVLGECSEAHLRHRLNGEPFGPAMMITVLDRLKHLAEREPKRVYYQPYDFLIGVMSSLTSDTRVWWSPRFPVQESAA
jgi:hypothetical protein